MNTRLIVLATAAAMLAAVPAAYAAPKNSQHCIENSKKSPCAAKKPEAKKSAVKKKIGS